MRIFYDPKTLVLFIILLVASSFFLGTSGGFITNFQCPEKADYGFPLAFSLHCTNMAGALENNFYWSILLIDAVIWYLISLGTIFAYTKIRR